jgi:hypothetical protein
MAPRYRTKQKKCEAGEACECVGKPLGLFGLLNYFKEDVNDIQRESDYDERCCLLEDINPCFLRTVRELTFDVLRGKIIIDEAYHGIFKYKEVLLKICRPQIPHGVAHSRLLRYNQIFPKLQPLWWECLYEIRDVLVEEEDKKKKKKKRYLFLGGDDAPISAEGCHQRRAPRYRIKRRKCDAGDVCSCVNLDQGALDFLKLYERKLEAIHRERDLKKRYELSESIGSCLFRAIRGVTFDLLGGKILIDEVHRGIFKYKAPLLNICRPQIGERTARSRFLSWIKILPKLQPIWWKCLLAIKDVLVKQDAEITEKFEKEAAEISRRIQAERYRELHGCSPPPAGRPAHRYEVRPNRRRRATAPVEEETDEEETDDEDEESVDGYPGGFEASGFGQRVVRRRQG